MSFVFHLEETFAKDEMLSAFRPVNNVILSHCVRNCDDHSLLNVISISQLQTTDMRTC